MMVFDQAYAGGYDALYRDKDYVAECDMLERAVRECGSGVSTRWLDIGCGTGGHAIELATRGYCVTGVDAAPAMLERAHAKASYLAAGTAPRFVLGDARSFELDGEPFDVVVMMFAVLGYMTSNEDLGRALRVVRRHLRPGGLFVCDFWWGPAVLVQQPGDRVRMVQEGESTLLRATRTALDVVANVAEVRFDLFDFSSTAPAMRSTETHRMRYLFGPELQLLGAAAGLELAALRRFPEFDVAPDATTWNAVMAALAA